MNKLTGLKDVDREILSRLDDKELFTVCQIDKRFWNTICDDNFLKRRLSKYNKIEQYKKENETWKQFFLRVIYIISKMYEDFKFVYTMGDFENQYKLLKNYSGTDNLLLKSAAQGELFLVIYALNKDTDILKNRALGHAAENGHLNVVRYLTEKGADIHANYEYAIRVASKNKHLDIVKYLTNN